MEVRMWRLFIIIGLGGAMLVTSACDDSAKGRTPLKKARDGGNTKASERTKGINKAAGEKGCLRIDNLLKAIISQKNETVLIYTSDLDLGLVTGNSDQREMSFESQVDDKARAHAFLKDPVEPLVEAVASQDLQSSTKAFLFSPASMDDECKTVTFANIVRKQFAVVKKSKDSLWLQNREDTSELIHYNYNRKDKLFITHYTPNVTLVCGKTPRMLKRTYVLAREEGLNHLEVDRKFAEMIAKNITPPLELAAALSKGSSRRVTLSYPAWSVVQQILRSDKFAQPACN